VPTSKKWATATSAEMLTNGYLELWDELHTFKKPIVAAVSGYCLGGGAELAMVCDMIVAFGNGEVLVSLKINIGVISPVQVGTQTPSRALVGKVKSDGKLIF
jgi:enoyl-CoA hydratase